jgi:excisionase family DNA binding protein
VTTASGRGTPLARPSQDSPNSPITPNRTALVNARNYPAPDQSGRRSAARQALALSTGQVARFCLVSPDTVVAWIKKDRLAAQRTLGGRFRIFVSDLRRFMVQHGMSTAALDAEFRVPLYCWEYCPLGRSGNQDVCRTCLAYRAKAMHCYTLRFQFPSKQHRHADCEQCEYLQYCVGQLGEPGMPEERPRREDRGRRPAKRRPRKARTHRTETPAGRKDER